MLRKFACLLTVAIALSCAYHAQAQLPNGGANREATLQYLEQFAAIMKRESPKITRDSPLEQDAQVYRSMARQIRSIPTHRVDPELLECAWKTANFLDRKARWADEVAQLPANALVAVVFSSLVDYGLFMAPVVTPIVLGKQLLRAERLEEEAQELRRDGERLGERWVEVLTRLQRRYNLNLD